MLKQARGGNVDGNVQAYATPDQNTGGVNGLTQALLMFKTAYGDITVNQLLENFRRDYGELKLSDFLGLLGKK